MSPLLEINQLETTLHTSSKSIIAVDGLSLKIFKGETLALVGESGCGKSMTALSIMRLLPDVGEITAGSIKLADEDLLLLPEVNMRRLRGKQIGMIFQEPMLSLNPVMTVAEQIGETLQRHFNLRGKAAQQRIIELLDQVGIPDAANRMLEYPFQFSGGMKQRVMIAIALAGEPKLLIADEPTTALDVTIQAQVLDLMRSLQKHKEMSVLLITHDLGVVAEMAHRVAVMYAGEIIETTSRDTFFNHPAHPYSQKLFDSIPGKNKRNNKLAVIKGNVPPLSQTFIGCRFAERCEHAWQHCHQTIPTWHQLPNQHYVRCHLFNSDKKTKVTNLKEEVTATQQIPVPTSTPNNNQLLHVSNLKVYFPIRKGLIRRVVGQVKAVDGVSLTIAAGKTLAIVVESGCGKTTVGKSILQLIQPIAGSVCFDGLELTELERKQLRKKRADLQIIFQDPYASLNPKMRIIDIIKEGIDALSVNNPSIAASHNEKTIDSLLQQVGLHTEAKWSYPHEFSGGQRQRIAIARALAVNPKLLICDEPTSALDVSVQAQILNLLTSLQNKLGLAYLFITHNLSVVEFIADDVAVMYLGRIVEQGPVDTILNSPKHPYTQALLSAVPNIDQKNKPDVIHLTGDLPSPAAPPSGCHFHTRCPHVMPICHDRYPEVSIFDTTHTVHCHLYSQILPVE